MSLTYMADRQRDELKTLMEISKKQDEQIALLERIIRILERKEDDGK